MKQNLQSITSAQLVERFAEIALKQYQAIEGGKISVFNRLYGEMAEISNELKIRNGDHRRLLMSLYGHENSQVRLKAAIHTLALEPFKAREQLEAITKRNWEYQAGDSGMILRGLDDGSFKPT